MNLLSQLRKKSTLFLLAILIVAGFLRFYNLSTNPPGIHADEADSGYNAYSILKTGRDFYGNFLPLQIVGFAQNYRTPLSTYITIPFVAVFGLAPLSVRMPTALLGIAFVYLIYLFSKRIFDSEWISIIAAFLAAVNPWAVHISRPYADHILALDFVILALVLVINKSKNYWPYIFSGIFLGLSLFSYHAPKIFLPLFLPFLLIYLIKKGDVPKKFLLISILVFVLFYTLVLGSSFFGQGGQEYKNVTAINKDVAQKIVDKERRVTNAPLAASGIFHNKPLFYFKELARNTGKFISINYLFLDGESNLTAWVGDRGLFYLVELPLLLIGLYFLFTKKRQLFWFFFFWFVAAIIPGAITRDQMYTYRGIYLLPLMLMIIAFGIYSAFNGVFNKKKTIFIFVLGAIYLLSIISYYFHYFYDYPVYSRAWWAAEDHEAINYIIQNQHKYEKFFSDGGNDWVLLYAFDTNYDPVLFEKALKNPVKISNRQFVKIDNLYVGSIHPRKGETLESVFPKNSLYLGRPGQFNDAKPLREILSKEDWGTVYKIFEIK